MGMMQCKRCKSTNVIIQAVAVQKRRGCLSSLLWILLAICTVGLILLIPLLMNKGSKTVNYAICQNCGNRWRVR